MTASKAATAHLEAANDASATNGDAAATVAHAPAVAETGSEPTTAAASSDAAAPTNGKKPATRLPTRKSANGTGPKTKAERPKAEKAPSVVAASPASVVTTHDSAEIDARLHAQRHLQLLGTTHALCGVVPEAAGDKATFQFVLSEAARQTHMAPDHRSRFCAGCIVELGALTTAIPEPGGLQPPLPYTPDLEEPTDEPAPVEGAEAAPTADTAPIAVEIVPSPPAWIAMLPTGAVAMAIGIDRAAAKGHVNPFVEDGTDTGAVQRGRQLARDLGDAVAQEALTPAVAGEAFVLVFDHAWRGEISERSPFIVPHVSDGFAQRCSEHLERLAVDADLADFTFDVTQPPPRPIAGALPHSNGAVQ